MTFLRAPLEPTRRRSPLVHIDFGIGYRFAAERIEQKGVLP
jgi:hypothetical protein